MFWFKAIPSHRTKTQNQAVIGCDSDGCGRLLTCELD